MRGKRQNATGMRVVGGYSACTGSWRKQPVVCETEARSGSASPLGSSLYGVGPQQVNRVNGRS